MNHLDLVGLRPLMNESEGAQQIVIGVVDGPVFARHPAFSETVIREIRGRVHGKCSNRGSIACAHGTFVTGIMGAKRTSNTPGICPGCTFLVIPIFSEEKGSDHWIPTCTPEALGRAIIDAVSAGANVINLSASISGASLVGAQQLKQSLDYAALHRVLVVVAAGNQREVGSSVLTGHPWVITVVSCDNKGTVMADSNLGRSIGTWGLAAPGETITSLGTNKTYSTQSGTSVAAPFVTGAVALLWSVFRRASAEQIKLAVTKGAGGRRKAISPPLLNAWLAYKAMSGN